MSRCAGLPLRMASCTLVLAAVLAGGAAAPLQADGPPAVGDPAPDFTLPLLHGERVTLSKLHEAGPVVLIVLRGHPGYQCPVCNAQVGRFLAQAEKLRAVGASVLLVYPGPAEGLQKHAAEFVRGKDWPGHFHLALDADFEFTSAYGLRWNARNETAYPATFVVDREGVVRFGRISRTHGDRASPEDVLQALAAE